MAQEDQDLMEYGNKCEACRYYENFINQLLEPFHPTATSWTFEVWGLNLVGTITPKSSAGHSYILLGTITFQGGLRLLH